MTPIEIYGSLMVTIRNRFDVIEALRFSNTDYFSKAETAAFHGRKIVEAIAFACLAAIDNKFKIVPKDAKGHWNAEVIFKNLVAKNLLALPCPSILRDATYEEKMADNVSIVIEGVLERNLTHKNIVEIYQRLHYWLHETNPYIYDGHAKFYAEKSESLWADLEKIHLFLERHFISIRGSAFYCTLRDSQDGETKVLPLNKEKA